MLAKKSTLGLRAPEGVEIFQSSAKINYQIRINIITQYRENHILGSCIIDDIINFGWSRWEYNRTPDIVRVEEIVKYIERGHSIDWLFYFIYLDGEVSSLAVYDGLHRMTAIGEYIKQFEKQQDIRCPLRDSTILISIRINPTPGEVVDAFTFINKSVPVPDLYFAKHIKKDIVENVVKKWQDKYKRHFKSTLRTNIPNINRDVFIDIVGQIYDYYNINEDKKKLEKALNKINNYIKNIYDLPNNTISENAPNNTVSENALKKCRETECYIFLVKHSALIDYIKKNKINI